MLLAHSVEDGLHHTRGNRDACLANTVALLSQRMGMIAAQASRGSRPSFLFSSSHRRSVRVESQGWKTSGSHAARWSAIILLSHPCKWRSSAQSTTQSRRSRDGWWYARFDFAGSTAATASAPSVGALLSPKSDMPWRHQPGRFACGKSSGGASSVATQLHRACVYCSSIVGFSTRLFFRAWWPPLHLQLGCRIVPHESKEVFFLVVPLRPSCRRWTRTTSEEPFQ